MSYPYVAWQTFHRLYPGGRAANPQIWFATKKSGNWATSLVYESAYTAVGFGEYPYIGVANNGLEFLLIVSWYGAGVQKAFQSLDEGATWNELSGAQIPLFQRLYRCQGMWVGVGRYGVEVSNDGLTWDFHDSPTGFNEGNSQQNQIAIDLAGRIHICGFAPYEYESIQYAMTPDLGRTWQESTPITLSSDYGLRWGCIAAYDSHVIVAAAVEGATEYGIIANFSHDGGITWDSEHGELSLVYEYATSYVSEDYEALGFYGGDLYVVTNGWVDIGVNDEYRVWSYRCTDWQSPGSHSWAIETIGTWHEGVCAGTEPETGEGIFLESYNGFFRTDPYEATIWHNQLVELAPTGWMGQTVIQQRTPEPLPDFGPSFSSPDYWLLTPMNWYAPPPNWYTEDVGGYSVWW